MEIEKLIHTADGELKSELPFWRRPCRVRFINPDAYSGYGFAVGDIAVIDNDCLERVELHMRKIRKGNRYARIKADRVSSSTWVLIKDLEEIDG